MSMGMQTHCSTVVHVQGDVQTMYLFRAIWEFAQSRDCVAHSQNPEIACAIYELSTLPVRLTVIYCAGVARRMEDSRLR